MKTFSVLLLLFLTFFCLSSPVFAHPHHDIPHSHGFSSGFSHPWLGVDHLLAMVAVGLLAVQIGGRAHWVLPLSFLGMMLAGGAIGLTGRELSFVELGIALSVVVLGAALAVGKKYSLLASGIIIGSFGFVHGQAHGAEIPGMTSPMTYVAGFILATALLHLTGVLGGMAFMRNQTLKVCLRLSGVAISFVGLMIFFHVL